MIFLLLLTLVCSVTLTIGCVLAVDAIHNLWRIYEASDTDLSSGSHGDVIHRLVPKQSAHTTSQRHPYVHAEPLCTISSEAIRRQPWMDLI